MTGTKTWEADDLRILGEIASQQLPIPEVARKLSEARGRAFTTSAVQAKLYLRSTRAQLAELLTEEQMRSINEHYSVEPTREERMARALAKKAEPVHTREDEPELPDRVTDPWPKVPLYFRLLDPEDLRRPLTCVGTSRACPNKPEPRLAYCAECKKALYRGRPAAVTPEEVLA